MGRKGSSGMKPITYKVYDTAKESYKGLGYTNGGATDQWMGKLTNDEKAAIVMYTGPSYINFNEALRKGTPLLPHQEAMDKGLSSAIAKYELTEPTVFIRGSSTHLLGGANTVDKINAMAGQVVSDDAYLSTAAHSKGGFTVAIKYHIHTPAGKGIGAYIVGLSQIKKENEFLFDKGSAFKVMGGYMDEKGRLHCDLEYVGKK